ncbi:unnamed protein product [Vitrella brassicaformis CCMP3155]|uniref:Peptidase S74 domain-containing protein n=1 Tax=Vitrella brassicaformis (strain CCMP3155) TaxID=1169540 RepID=A0A0G4EWM7_VITBC|nr:unnamed protein product [Vitrella brassicaformis CCMP3155]|eukprot:CEM02469.1 unnamed protein product [Vitrella brassicaformis CCMP3155]
MGDTLSVFGLARLASTLSVLDYVSLGSSLSVRQFAYLGSTLSVEDSSTFNNVEIRGTLNVVSGATLNLQAGSTFVLDSSSPGAVTIDTDACSVIHASGCNSSSDRRLKTLIQPVEGYLSWASRSGRHHVSRSKRNLSAVSSRDRDSVEHLIDRLRPVKFEWKQPHEGIKRSNRVHFGLIAQDVATLLPEVVSKEPRTGTLRIRYMDFISILLESAKQLHRRFRVLERRVASLDFPNLDPYSNITTTARLHSGPPVNSLSSLSVPLEALYSLFTSEPLSSIASNSTRLSRSHPSVHSLGHRLKRAALDLKNVLQQESAAERMDAHESDHEVDSLRRKIEDMGASTARRINDMARRHEEAIKLHQEEIRLLKEQNRRQDEEIRLLKQQLQRPLAGHASSTRAPRDEDYTLIEAPR